MEREHTLRACAKKDEGRQYYICSHHDSHTVTKSTTVTRFRKNNKPKKWTIKHSFVILKGVGVRAASPPMQKSKGLGNDRAYKRILSNMKDDITHLDNTKRKKPRHSLMLLLVMWT